MENANKIGQKADLKNCVSVVILTCYSMLPLRLFLENLSIF